MLYAKIDLHMLRSLLRALLSRKYNPERFFGARFYRLACSTPGVYSEHLLATCLFNEPLFQPTQFNPEDAGSMFLPPLPPQVTTCHGNSQLRRQQFEYVVLFLLYGLSVARSTIIGTCDTLLVKWVYS
jgi:hypothetical protein